MNISGNTIFIPGSTSGIGLALALALEARGDYDKVVETLNHLDPHGK